jgi:hypothetical protein
MTTRDKWLIRAYARSRPVLLLFLFLIGCERRQETPVADADIELMKDVGAAGPELERRLLASVSIRDGLIMVRLPSSGDTYVLPGNSPWIITCGSEGVSVTLGSAVSGDRSYVGNDVQLDLTMTLIGQADCATLAPQLGRRLKAMLQEPVHPQ